MTQRTETCQETETRFLEWLNENHTFVVQSQRDIDENDLRLSGDELYQQERDN